jgi:acyl carrier protein
MALTKEKLVDHLVSQYAVEPDVGDETALFSTGLLDSFCMVGVIAYMEKEMGQKLKLSEITLGNFDTIGRMIRFAEQKQGIGGAS